MKNNQNIKFTEETPLTSIFRENENSSFKILIKIYKGNYLKLLSSAFFFFLKHAPAWLLPIVFSEIVNIATYSQEHQLSEIGILVIVMVVLIILNVPTNYMHTRLYSQAIRSVEARLRSALVRRLQQLSFTYHKDMQSGRLQSKIMRDVENIEIMSTQVFTNMLGIIINVGIAFIVTISKSKIVFVFFLLAIPLALITTMSFRKKIKKSNQEFRGEMEETSAKVVEMVELIPLTKAHSLEELEISRMDSQINKVAEKGYSLDIVQSFFGSINWVVFQVLQIVCLGFTGVLAYQGKISIGEIVLYQSYFASIVGNIIAVVNLIPTITKGLESIESIGDILLTEDIENNRGKRRLKTLKGKYEFNDVSFWYDEKQIPVLENFNLKVNRGETVALVGASGSGKTTIINIIIGFLMPNKGIVTIDNINIKDIDLHSYREEIAVVPQENFLFEGTLRDNITYGINNVSDEDLYQVLEEANLLDLVKSLPEGLDSNIGDKGGKLSGGQRQRVSIARAMVRDPKVIVLDEATSALDSLSETKLQKSLERLTLGKTTFVVAHRLATIKDADKILVLKDGKCIEMGTYDELMDLKQDFYRMKVLQSE